MKKRIKCDLCPECKKEMDLLFNGAWRLRLLGIYGDIRGQVCNNKKCKQYGIDRRHDREYKQMTREEDNYYYY